MPPTGLLSFPGVDQVLSWSFTLSHGITPGAALVEIAPQFGLPAEVGTMVLSFGDVALEFGGCVLDSATVRRDESGMIVSLTILDRRWRWRYGQISGRYNVRQKDGTLDTTTEQTPQQLARRLLEAMGESECDLSGLPNLARPEVDWVYANPAHALAELAESLGCRVVLDLDGLVSLPTVGTGADLPDTGTQRTWNFGIDPPTRPESLLLVGGPTRFQTMFRLEAVGQEPPAPQTTGQSSEPQSTSSSTSTTAGQIVPIDELSYKPVGGWQNESYLGFANVQDPAARAKARETIYRWYRILSTAPMSTAGEFQIAGCDSAVNGLWQILPIERGLIDTYTGSDGIERPQPPQVAGIFWDRSLDANNIPVQRPYRGRFTLDAERGIVMFDEPVLQVDSTGTAFAPAELYLTVAHAVKDPETLQELRQTWERDVPGSGTESGVGTGAAVFRRDDMVLAVTTQYDANNNPKGRLDNSDALDRESEYQLDAIETAFETVETDFVEYAGLVAINPDGAISQVSWSGGPAGTVTRAGRNSEFSLTVPPYPERRRTEQHRQQHTQQLTAAGLAAIKVLRDYRGGR